jgi:flagellar biosynthesis/type III secretory pathway M-ring protein FliF/YscJ
MAELDFDNDDELNLDDTDVDGLDDDLNLDDGDDGVANDGPTQSGSASSGGFFTRQRIFLILGIVVAVLIGVGVFFFARNAFSSDPMRNPNIPMTAEQKKAVEEKKKEEAEKKRRNRKIKYEVLFPQLSGTQAAAVLKQLSLSNISFTQEQNGQNFRISVDEERLEEAKNLLAVRGIPAGGAQGYELLDESQTLGVTEFDKRIRYLRALSGELERAVMQLDAVETAKVQIVLPEQRLFAVTQPPVTASILIRRVAGAEMNDDIVFSIIQYIANAVENLQPENVSVIDTEGQVLSLGIFERMAARQAGLLDEEDPDATPTADMQKVGQPIIPSFAEMKKWYEVKTKFERDLEDKVLKQLIGVLPIGSFKATVTADVGPLEKGKIVDIKRIAVGVVIDNNNDDIFLNQDLKQQIFATVSAAIGYKRGRDSIQLSRADFLLFTEAERRRLERLKGESDSISWMWFLLPLIPIALGLAWWWRRQQEERKKLVIEGGAHGDLDDLAAYNYQDGLNRIKQVAATQPEVIAEILNEYMEKSQDDTSLEEVT